MKVLLTVQRYHPEIVGGSEAAARGYCENLAAAGHEVEVITSCATSHHDWANELPEGTTDLNGVIVHRLPVERPRLEETFGHIHQRALSPLGRMNRAEARLWMSRIGPEIPSWEGWLDRNARRFDVAVVMTYMYTTATRSLPILHNRCPSIFIPTAHDERALHLGPFRSLFRLPDAFVFLTPEEGDLVRSTFAPTSPTSVIGVGLDPAPLAEPRDFRLKFGLGDDPYLVMIGRADAGKGTYEALEMFRTFKDRHPGPLKLVMIGEKADSQRSDIVTTGFCSEIDKHRALSGASALIQPSYMESFSIVLCEAWAHAVPVIVNGNCSVTAGQVQRSGGGAHYRSYSEFEAAVQTLLDLPEVADSAGRSGMDYVRSQYSWETVVMRLEALASEAVDHYQARSAVR